MTRETGSVVSMMVDIYSMIINQYRHAQGIIVILIAGLLSVWFICIADRVGAGISIVDCIVVGNHGHILH